MKTLNILLLALLSFYSVIAFAENKIEYQKFGDDVQVVDVRSAAEWKTGHHPDAINIPHSLILDGKELKLLDKNKTIVLYCRSGGRAQQALHYLKENGFTNVTNAGGISRLVVNKTKSKD